MLRVLDAFVLLRCGKKDSLPPNWHESQNWEQVIFLGAVASLSGEDTLLAQSGRFDKICWRWVILQNIEAVKIHANPRFRKRSAVKQFSLELLTNNPSEPCLWLHTAIADYAMIQPHRGYIQEWARSTEGLPGYGTIPQPRRCDPNGPMPAWWDAGAAHIWSEAAADHVAQRTKRSAPSSPQVEDSGAETAVVKEQISHAAASKSSAILASDSGKPNNLSMFADAVWDLEKDQAPPLQKEYPAPKTRDRSERRSKRTRAR